ncbi:MAG: RNA-directed DNA polymerase [Opitutales bacterium]
MHTERFRQLRKKALVGILDKKTVSKVWRSIVRDQLRSLDISDLYDNYDFNYNIEERAAALRASILEGSYAVATPLIYRLEKKYGVCRHIVIPQPHDALLLQVLIEQVADKIIDKQPSKNSFYSRDRHNVQKPHEAESDNDYGVPFQTLWKRLQKEIYKFNDSKNLLVVTDLSNYYDSIHLDELRKVLVSYVEADEVIVDLLFKVIEGISWTPDYLPYSKRGLPTSNIEGIRLLAHLFLFELDQVLKNQTKNSFVRWMDDITIGVDSRKEAISIISSASDMLKSRGLSLNLAKTSILDSTSAKFHFQIDQNKYLDSLNVVEAGTPEADKAETELNKRFQRHIKNPGAKYWDKVTKRYITAFGKLRSRKLVKKAPVLYLKYPGIRPNLLIYLTNIDYIPTSASSIEEILEKIDLFDDLALFQISKILTEWSFPTTSNGKAWIKKFDTIIANRCFENEEPIHFYSLLLFRSIYSSSTELLNFLIKYQNLWQTNSFLRRQATVCLARLLASGNNKGERLLRLQGSSGIPSVVSVANQISLFSRMKKLEGKVSMYLFPEHPSRKYPHSKFMVLCSLLNSEEIRKNSTIQQKVPKYLKDPFHRRWLRRQYGLKFE